jgi:RHS repeat-associated protein
LTYDNNGNLQTITDPSGTTTYTWNARNQLTGISGPGMSASFVYDGLGRREKKTINGSLTEFLYDGLNPVQETSGATILANILPGLNIDEFLTRTDVVAGVASHFLTNALGSPVAVTDNAGVVHTEYTYEPFGKTTFSGSSNNSSYQYTGRENDGTGLFYYRNRYYHPLMQRFISEDPIEFESGDFNLFAYVMNKPTNYTDPLGLDHAERLGRCLVLAGCVDRNGKPKTKTDPPPPKPPFKPSPFTECPGCYTDGGKVYDEDGKQVTYDPPEFADRVWGDAISAWINYLQNLGEPGVPPDM